MSKINICQACIAHGDTWDDDDDFEPCCDCDLPDACGDFGCAIKAGLRVPPGF